MGLLSELLTTQTIELDVQVATWEDAVLRAGSLMVKAGYVKEPYPRRMVELMKEFGPYVVLVPGFAMPHARPSDGAVGPGASLVRLRPPVDVEGAEDRNPVQIVLAISSENSTGHLRMIAAISRIVGTRACLEVLKSGNMEEIMTMIRRAESADLKEMTADEH